MRLVAASAGGFNEDACNSEETLQWALSDFHVLDTVEIDGGLANQPDTTSKSPASIAEYVPSCVVPKVD